MNILESKYPSVEPVPFNRILEAHRVLELISAENVALLASFRDREAALEQQRTYYDHTFISDESRKAKERYHASPTIENLELQEKAAQRVSDARHLNFATVKSAINEQRRKLALEVAIIAQQIAAPILSESRDVLAAFHSAESAVAAALGALPHQPSNALLRARQAIEDAHRRVANYATNGSSVVGFLKSFGVQFAADSARLEVVPEADIPDHDEMTKLFADGEAQGIEFAASCIVNDFRISGIPWNGVPEAQQPLPALAQYVGAGFLKDAT